MTFITTAVCCLALPAMLLFSTQSYGQFNRYILSFNAPGMLEPNGALGLGFGYAFNPRWELWSETSRLQHLFTGSKISGGIRQVLQMKYFPPYRNPDFFFAAEVRYKGYHYVDAPFVYHYKWWGTGLQVGSRQTISKKNGLFLEISVGMGYRHTLYDKTTAAPPGSPKYGRNKILDVEIADTYYPGSIRLVWMFGKKL